jgi:two-component system OmpR family sensor kinase
VTFLVTPLRALSARTPLRLKLVAALTLLVGLALVVTGFAASQALRGYLVQRVDVNLVQYVQDPHFHGPADADMGRPRRPGEYAFQTASLDGTVLRPFAVSTEGASPPRLPKLTPSFVAAHQNGPFTVSAEDGSQQWRLLLVPVAGKGTIAAAAGLADVESTVGHLALLELGIGAGVLLLFAGLGYGVVRSSLRPLVAVESTAEKIAGGDLTQRVPDGDPRTEVGRLALSLNGMLGQVERSFRAQQVSEATARQSEERMRRFVADASHELRTPLTSIRGFAELYRQGAVSGPDELDRVMRRVEDEAARMGLLVEDLLLLARLDQQRPLLREPVDLLELARDAVHDASAVAPDRRIEVAVVGEAPPVVLGDDARLRQVFGNLVGNALSHTPAGSPVVVRVGTTGDLASAVLEVADRGPGLSPDQRTRVFERFYRADASRTRAHGGSGLGLSIVAALVAAHGGRVEVESEPGQGATFRVLLPREPSYAAQSV